MRINKLFESPVGLLLTLLALTMLAVFCGCRAEEGTPASATPQAVTQPPVTGAPAVGPTPTDEGAPTFAIPTISPEEERTPGPGDAIAAMVNGQPIYVMEVDQQAAQFQAAMISQGYSFSGEEGRQAAANVRQQVLESMIDQILIEQAAQAQGIVIPDEEIQKQIQIDIEMVGSEEEFAHRLLATGTTREEYEQMLRSSLLADAVLGRLGAELPETMPQVRVREIVVDNLEESQRLREQLDAGADFAELARTHSRDESTREAGGDRGYVPLGASILLPEVELEVARLAPGQVAGPIATPYGYYLVQLVDLEDTRALTAEMRQGLTQEAFFDWIEQQRSVATIERFME